MKSKLFFLVTILTALCYLGIAYAGEEITLTTYYPAPYGEYGGLAVGDPINGYTAPADPIDLIVEGNVGIGTTVVPSYDKLLVNGGWLLVNFSGATSWGDTSARIGVCKTDNTAGLGPWHMSQNNDGKFAIHQNGVGDRLIIDGNGNVGIGTMSPGEKLVIADDTDADLDITTYGDNNDQSSIHLHKARGTAGAPSAVISTSDLGTWSSKGWDGSAWRTGAQIMMEVDGTPGSGDMPGRIMFLTTQDGGTTEYERMRITNTGNVGIGTTSPQRKLHIAKGNLPCIQLTNDTSGHGLLDGSIISQNGTALNIVNQESSLGAMYFYPGNTWASSPSVAFRENGNVGIGTANPQAKLEVNGGIKIKHSGSTVITLNPNGYNTITHNCGTTSWGIFAINGHWEANPFSVAGVDYINENSFRFYATGGAPQLARINWFILDVE